MITVTVLALADIAWRLNDYHTERVTPVGIMVLSVVIALLVSIGRDVRRQLGLRVRVQRRDRRRSPRLAQVRRRRVPRPARLVIVVYLLLAAPVVAALLFWGSWGWVAAALAVAVVEYVTLHRSQRFSGRVWRSVGKGRRSRHERAAERIYVISAIVGVALLVASLLGVG